MTTEILIDLYVVITIKQGQRETENLTFQIGEATIEETTSEKSLGAWINNDLTWSKHLKKLEDELHFRLFNLRRKNRSFQRPSIKRVADGIF